MRSGSGSTTVAVAVKSATGSGSQRAVRWAVENSKDRLVLIHVMPKITSVPTPSGGRMPIKDLDARVAAMYVQDIRSKCEETFLPYKYMCRTHKVETLLLEGDNPAFALLRYVSDSKTTSLVLGSCSSSYFARKPKDMTVPSIVLKHAPETCNIYVVYANKLISNSLNPILTSERERDSNAYSRQGSCTSSSIMDSKYQQCLSNTSQPPTESYSQRFTSAYSGSIQESGTYSSEDSLDMPWAKERSSISVAYSEQAEVERLRLELETTITMYSRACEDLVHAERKVVTLSSECSQEAQKVNAALLREESLRKIAAEQKEKYLEAEKEVETGKKLLAEESYGRQLAELKIRKESLEKQRLVDALFISDQRYRRYTRDDIQVATDYLSENKTIGEGAYGKVYKGSLDHTLVAMKVLRPDASEKKKEFLREVEVLSQLRHPNIVLLLGACPELSCLVYEYMENNSLEDHILHRKNKPPLPWRIRFRIPFEVACGLAFLHHSKPDPIVHRDLKPGNILLDKHYVSKIGDVGLAKMISDVVPDNVTEYNDSVIAGTIYYMDPEYQRTGTLRPKSDLYSFGVIILQLLSGSHPNGIITKFEKAVTRGTLLDILDKDVTDWPLSKAAALAEIALKCCSLRCRDRPDLEAEVLPVLKRLAEFADSGTMETDKMHAPKHYYCPILQEIMDDPCIAADGFTYEREAILAWIERHSVSPVTRQKLEHMMLTPNRMLRSAIQEWQRTVKSPKT